MFSNIAFSRHHDVFGNTHTGQATVDGLCGSSTVYPIVDDDQDVQVTVRSQRTTRGGPEKDDSFWLSHLDDSTDDIIQDVLADYSGYRHHDSPLRRVATYSRISFLPLIYAILQKDREKVKRIEY